MRSTISQNRNFGMIMAAAFGLLFFWRAYRHHQAWTPLLIVAAAFLILAFAAPLTLTRPRALWLAFGERLSRVTQPVILGIVFFLVLTPFGLLRRLTRKVGAPGNPKSHWVEETRSVNEDDLLRQF